MRKRLGLRTEVALHLGVLLTAALLFSGLVQLKLSERQQTRAHLDHLATQLTWIQSSLTGSLSPQSPDVLYRRVERLLKAARPLPAAYQLVNAVGTKVRSYPHSEPFTIDMSAVQQARLSRDLQLEIFSGSPAWEFLPGTAGRAAFTLPLAGDFGYAGALQVVYNLNDFLQDRWAAVNLMLIYAAGFGACLLFFGLSLLEKTVIRPIRKLSQATTEITQQSFTVTLEPEGSSEIADLTLAFNRMSQALASEKQKTGKTIDRLEQANLSLAQTREELVRSEKLASVGHLAAGMAHEIGNPLGATLGYLSFLKDELDDPQCRDIVERSVTELKRIDHLVRELLDYAAPSDALPERILLKTSVEDAIQMIQQQGAVKRMQIRCDIDESLLVCIQPQRMMQLVINLLLNARDATGGVGEVQISSQTQDSFIHLSFTDNGPGMDADTLKNVFEPFYTTKGPGEGRGLGLAVCQRVMEEAGGQIRVTANSGEGSCFELLFPWIEEGQCRQDD